MPQFSTNQMIGLQPKIEENWENVKLEESDSISLRQKNKAYCIYYMFRSQMRTFHFLFNQNKIIFMLFWTKNTRFNLYFEAGTIR